MLVENLFLYVQRLIDSSRTGRKESISVKLTRQTNCSLGGIFRCNAMYYESISALIGVLESVTLSLCMCSVSGM